MGFSVYTRKQHSVKVHLVTERNTIPAGGARLFTASPANDVWWSCERSVSKERMISHAEDLGLGSATACPFTGASEPLRRLES